MKTSLDSFLSITASRDDLNPTTALPQNQVSHDANFISIVPQDKQNLSKKTLPCIMPHQVRSTYRIRVYGKLTLRLIRKTSNIFRNILQKLNPMLSKYLSLPQASILQIIQL